MSLGSHAKTYGALGLLIAFGSGVLFTLVFYDAYDPEPRPTKRKKPRILSSMLDSRSTSLFLPSTAKLEDHTKNTGSVGTASVPVGVTSTIGRTPMFELASLTAITGLPILVKAEYLNGAGNSPKDRVALSIIDTAECAGLLTPHQGDTIYEGTSGSTGISIASLARARGYKAHICVDTEASMDKVHLLHYFGAIVERVSPAPITSIDHYVNLAKRRAEEHARKAEDGSKGFFADQFENEANWNAHFRGTGPEIFEQCNGNLAAFVAGAGTGGTISGVACYLKEEMGMSDVQVVLADPEGSGLYNKVKYGVMYSPKEKEGTKRRNQVDTIVEGIGINRLTENFDRGREFIDDAIKVSDEQAKTMAQWLVQKEGVFAGSSTAINCVAAIITALRLKEEGKHGNVVTILCDSGNRHLSKFWKSVAELNGKESPNEEDLLSLLKISKNGGVA